MKQLWEEMKRLIDGIPRAHFVTVVIRREDHGLAISTDELQEDGILKFSQTLHPDLLEELPMEDFIQGTNDRLDQEPEPDEVINPAQECDCNTCNITDDCPVVGLQSINKRPVN